VVVCGTKQVFVVCPMLSVLACGDLLLPLFRAVGRGGSRMRTETQLIINNEIGFDLQLALFEQGGCSAPMLKLKHNSLLLMS
jgi:hypothetical protein